MTLASSTSAPRRTHGNGRRCQHSRMKRKSITTISALLLFLPAVAGATFTITYSSSVIVSDTQLHSYAVTNAPYFDFTVLSEASSTVLSGVNTGESQINDVIYSDFTSASVLTGCNVGTDADLGNNGPYFTSVTPSTAAITQDGTARYVSDGTALLNTTINNMTRQVSCVMSKTFALTVTSFNSLVSSSASGVITSQFNTIMNGLSPSGTTENIYSATDDIDHVYTRNTGVFTGSADLTAIPVWSDWDRPPPTGGNTYGGARFNGVLVAPDILIQAHHTWAGGYDPHTVYFVKNDNTTVAMNVSGHVNVSGTDLEVVKLSSDVPSGITPVKILDTGTAGTVLGPTASSLAIISEGNKMTAKAIVSAGLPTVFTNQNRTLHMGLLAEFSPSSVLIVLPDSNHPNTAQYVSWYSPVVSGASGDPAFLVINWKLVALGDWWTSNLVAGANTSNIMTSVSAINSAITSLGSTHSLNP